MEDSLGLFLSEHPRLPLIPQTFTQISTAASVASQNHNLESQNHRITEYLELKGNHRYHQIQLLAPRRTTQESKPMSVNIIQTFLKLQQPGALGSLFHAHTPSAEGTDSFLLIQFS